MSRLGFRSAIIPPKGGSPACNTQRSYDPRSYDFSKSRETALWVAPNDSDNVGHQAVFGRIVFLCAWLRH